VTPDPNHSCSVLVVEDDVELCEVIRVALTTDGFDVSGAGNGREALHHLRSTAETCLIVLDLSLPVMDGRQFRISQLRDRSLAWIPVIVLSGELNASGDARELGARSFVRKPVDLDQLRRTVRQVGCGAQVRTDQRLP